MAKRNPTQITAEVAAQIEAKLRNILRRGEQQLDPETRDRLLAARRLALQAAGQKQRPWPWARPAGAVALLMAALFVGLYLPRAPNQPMADLMDEEIEMLAAGADLELYEELDFYHWLDSDGPAG